MPPTNPSALHPFLLLAWVAATAPVLGQAGGANLTHTIADVRHVVVFVQENRSFDHYFGALAGVRGFGDRSVLQFPDGSPCWAQPAVGGAVLPFIITNQCVADLAHDWGSGHSAWDHGLWDAWVGAKGAETMASYTRASLPYYYALADAYTVCDGYHCSVMGPTNPNRLYLMSGMVDPDGTGGGPVIDNREPNPGFTWTTYPERLQAAGVSWKIYQEADNYDDNALAWFANFRTAAPGNPLYDRGQVTVPDLVRAFAADVAAGTLPQVSWIIAAASLSEHPSAAPAAGEALTEQLLSVGLGANPAVANSTLFILTYDENDGFFDHVPPPVAPAGTPGEFVSGAPIGLGVRVPAILISPWTRGGYVCSDVFDHTSILRFLETWTGVAEPNISAWRRQVCGDLTSAMDFAHPDFSPPDLPGVTKAVCTGTVSPPPPASQVLPAQEEGFKPVRPLSTQAGAACALDCAGGLIRLALTNAGPATAHFAVYANAYLSTPPVQRDVAAGGVASLSFGLSGAAGSYDLTCYGPAGFLRRFAGTTQDACGLEVGSLTDPAGGGLTLSFTNGGATAASFSVTNGYAAGGPWSVPVAAGGTAVLPLAIAVTNGLYDLTVTSPAAPGFVRRLAGRTSAISPALTTSWSAGRLVVAFPLWASGFTLESSAALAPATWRSLAASTNLATQQLFVAVPPGPSAQFFRLRQ